RLEHRTLWPSALTARGGFQQDCTVRIRRKAEFQPNSSIIAAACRSIAGQGLIGPSRLPLLSGAPTMLERASGTGRSTHPANGTTNVRRLAPLPRGRMGDAPNRSQEHT